MRKKICYYNETPLVERDYERYGFETFLARGFQVSFVDVTRVIHPRYLVDYEPPNLSNYPHVFVARTQEEAVRFVERNRDAFGIVILGCNHETRFLYRAFKKFGVQYAQYESLPIPITAPFSFEVPKLMAEIKRLNHGAASRLLFRKLRSLAIKARLVAADLVPARLVGVQPPSYSLRATRKYIRISPTPARDTKILWLHYLDYDLYLKLRENPVPESPASYGVFLDEYFPFHPDYRVFNATPLGMRADRYYESLNRFFDLVERSLRMPVVIAAHPRARYDLGPDYFRGRRVEQFKTAELVSRATLVLAHESRSINFAVMFRKPVVFLTCEEIEETRYGSYVRHFAATLGKKPINVDGELEVDWEREFAIDEEKYGEYFANHIKAPGTPERPFWDVVADAIEENGVAIGGAQGRRRR